MRLDPFAPRFRGRPDLKTDGLIDTSAIYVDSIGNYFTNQNAVDIWKKP
jgi:hypothetical protein